MTSYESRKHNSVSNARSRCGHQVQARSASARRHLAVTDSESDRGRSSVGRALALQAMRSAVRLPVASTSYAAKSGLIKVIGPVAQLVRALRLISAGSLVRVHQAHQRTCLRVEIAHETDVKVRVDKSCGMRHEFFDIAYRKTKYDLQVMKSKLKMRRLRLD